MKNLFNKILFSVCLVFAFSYAKAQVGLEGILVEKYYVANAADNAAVPTLPVGAVTYRVYADLAPGWGFQALYGDPTNNHFLKVTSTTNFLNFSGGTFAATGLDNTTFGTGAIALDSYFTIGATSDGSDGVLKTEDNGLLNLVSSNPILNNVTPAIGLGLHVQDGNVTNPAPDAPTIVGLLATQQNVFKNAIVGNSLIDNDCAVSTGAASGQTVGPTASNRVLIGQFTTAGDFGFELNVQIRNTTTFAVERWVANTPVSGEFTMPSLTLVPNTPPTCILTLPASNASVITGTIIPLAATATDALPGTVTQVQFFLDGTTLISTDNTSPYTGSWTSIAGCHTITAVATDNDGAQTTSSPAITICSGANQAPTVTISGVPASICQPDVVTVVASPVDVDGTIASVQFYLDNALVFTDVSAPYQYAWTSVAGSHTFKATATDNLGAVSAFSPLSTVNVVLNNPPTCVLTSPLPSGTYTAPAIVPIEATATDLLDVVCPGSVALVKFFVNAVLVGSDNTAPYTFNWTSVVGNAVFTARSFDNRGDSTTSAPVALVIADPAALPYRITNLNQTCVSSTFCLTIAKVANTPADTAKNIIGYDFVLNYDTAKVIPTGIIVVNNDMTDSTHVDVANSIDQAHAKMNISLYFNAGAPNGTTWHGKGNIMCVQFAKRAFPAFGYVDTANFSISTLQESYANSVQFSQASAGKFTTYRDSLIIAPLKFWADNSPIVYTNAAQHLITNIYGTTNATNDINGSCSNRSAIPVQPDASGYFSHSIWNGTYVDIERDILPTTSVQPVVNGYDVYLVRRLLILDASFTPNIYQMIAMDVNRDGVISAGDASQISQRAVLAYPEFRQSWNYDISGSHLMGSGDSKDWTFLSGSSITTTPSYGISTLFPADNGVGFSKYRVPVIPFCLQTPVMNAIDCPIITNNESYIGVMLGDVNGNYSSLPSNATLRSADRVVFDLSKALTTGDDIDIPVVIVTGTEINALDLAVTINTNALAYNSIKSHATNVQMYDHFNTNDNTLRLTSNSLDSYNVSQPILSVRFNLKNGKFDVNDLLSVDSYLNGEKVTTEIRGSNGTISNGNVIANVYPNPTSGMLYVSVEQNATVQLLDISGKELILQVNVIANKETEINASSLANGIYLMKIYNDNFVSTKKVVINK